MARQHPNVLKLRKQKRMRRAWARPFNDIKVPRSINKDTPEPSDDGIDYSAMYQYRTRGEAFWDNTLDRIFGFHKAQPLMLSKQRLAVITRLDELTNMISPECNVVVFRGGITKTIIRFYFATDFSLCFFMREDWIGMYMDKSEVYEKKKFDLRSPQDRAYDDYNNNRLKWVKRVYLPTIVPDPPSG